MPKGKKKAEVIGIAEAPEMVTSGSADPIQPQDPTPVGATKGAGLKKKTSFDVYNPDGGLVRTYSVEIHGENAEALANEFASHTGGKVV